MNNPPAFPNEGFNGWGEPFQGMTLRDYFAAKAMKEIMAQAYELEQECFADGDFSFPDTMCSLAKEAYKWADALLKARES